MAVTFSDLHTEAGLKSLNELLSGKAYLNGDSLTKDDVKVYSAVLEKPGNSFPNAKSWYDVVSGHLEPYFPGKAVGVGIGGNAAPAAEVKEFIFAPKPQKPMDCIANAFSVLELDSDDNDHVQKASDNSNVDEDTSNSDDKNLKSMSMIEEIYDQKTQEQSMEEYKMPLVWIDLEMTGLNIEVDRILEIACIITDGKLSKQLEGPDLVIHQTKDCLDKMGEWCQTHHAASGLTKKVLQSSISENEAEKQVIDFVKRNVGTYTPHLAGNSAYVDFQFIKKYMPDLASLFSHVLVDVSSVKALCLRWYPRDNKNAPSKEQKHRSMDDIRESIRELKYYKDKIFKASQSRK